MAMSEHLPLAEVKNRLSEVVERIQRFHGRVVITKHGKPAAVLVSVEDLESLEETLEIMSDKKAMKEIRQGLAEHAAGKGIRLSKAEALKLVKRR